MKITDITAISLSRMHDRDGLWKTNGFQSVKADASIITVHTDDESLTGISEASAYGVPSVIAGNVARIKRSLIGRDPLDVLRRGLHPTGVSLSYDCAIAGIDAALWDIRGKLEGKRVADLLRPEGTPSSIPLYASGGCTIDWRGDPEILIEEVLRYKEQGFTACKVRIGTRWAWDDVRPRRVIDLYRELRQAVGDGFGLMCDAGCQLTEEEALELGRGLDDLHFAWFEEPVDRKDRQGYIRLNRALGLPVTGGEAFTTLEQFYPYIESGAFGIVQLDVGISGMTESWRIVEVAELLDVPVCPHNWHNGLLTMVQANLVAALADSRVLELCRHQGPLQWDILQEPPEISDGRLILPAAPGYGVALAEGIEERYPFIEGRWFVVVDREDVLVQGPGPVEL